MKTGGRILFITATRIGDAVLASGILARLITEYPDEEITVACGPLAAPLFGATPNVTQIIEMPKRPGGLHWLGLWRKVVPYQWRLVVDLRRSVTGYAIRSGEVWRLPPTDDRMHRVPFLSTIFQDQRLAPPHIYSSEAAVKNAAGLIPPGLSIGLGISASRPDKVWPAENFAALANRLVGEGGIAEKANVILFGGPGEEPVSEALIGHLPHLRIVNLVGKTDLLTAHACFKRLSVFVGNDSGLMHLAAAAGAPVVGLFGQTKSEHYGPWGDACTAVQAPDYGAMAAIEVKPVLEAVDRVIRK